MSKVEKSKEFDQCKYENYEVISINRDKIKNAPYNPRKISAAARKKLKDNLEKVGLLAPIVWNKKTGNIVSGHQRINALDTLSKTYEYSLRVSAVELDEKIEKSQNLFMNNRDAQGEFDIDEVEKMLKDVDLDIAGIELSDVYKAFGEDVSEEVSEPAKLEELAEGLRKQKEAHFNSTKTGQAGNDPNFYSVLVFKSHAERKNLTDALGVDDNRYIDGRLVIQNLLLNGNPRT